MSENLPHLSSGQSETEIRADERAKTLTDAENMLRSSLDEPWGDRAANRLWGLRIASAEQDSTPLPDDGGRLLREPKLPGSEES